MIFAQYRTLWARLVAPLRLLALERLRSRV